DSSRGVRPWTLWSAHRRDLAPSRAPVTSRKAVGRPSDDAHVRPRTTCRGIRTGQQGGRRQSLVRALEGGATVGGPLRAGGGRDDLLQLALLNKHPPYFACPGGQKPPDAAGGAAAFSACPGGIL